MTIVSILLEDIVILTMLAVLVMPASIILQPDAFLKPIDLDIVLQVHLVLSSFLEEVLASFFYLYPLLVGDK